jgi:hypothetical protein
MLWSMTGTAARGRSVAAAAALVVTVAVTTGPEPARDAPTLNPDRVVLTPTADPATSQAVTWRTSDNAAAADAEIRRVGDGSTRQVVADSSRPYAADGFTARAHTAVFHDLDPATSYTYRVGDGTHWSDWSEFTTAAALPEPFTFVYLGDAQTGLSEAWAALVQATVADEADARLWLHAGDLVNDAGNDPQWGAWFDSLAPAANTALMVASAGNHDHRDPHRVSRNWQPQFAYPANGPDGVPDETVYYVDYQGVRFVVLNSNTALDEQAAWLDDVLAENPGRWSVVVFHHPVFSTAEDRDNPEVRDAWLRVLEDHDVDLVLQGHDHTYGRGQQSENGPVYVISVSGSKMYDLGDPEETWAAHGAELQHSAEDVRTYQVIDVDGDTMRYEARRMSGDVEDAFTIVKNGDGKRMLEGER